MEVDYRRAYIATFCEHPAGLRRELVKKEIPESIEKWKKSQKNAGLVRGWKDAMLPHSYWLLKMTELMKDMSHSTSEPPRDSESIFAASFTTSSPMWNHGMCDLSTTRSNA